MDRRLSIIFAAFYYNWIFSCCSDKSVSFPTLHCTEPNMNMKFSLFKRLVYTYFAQTEKFWQLTLKIIAASTTKHFVASPYRRYETSPAVFYYRSSLSADPQILIVKRLCLVTSTQSLNLVLQPRPAPRLKSPQMTSEKLQTLTVPGSMLRAK